MFALSATGRHLVAFAMMSALLLAVAEGARAQETNASTSQPAQLMELRTADGTRTVGHVVSMDEETIVFESIAGVRMDVRRQYAQLRPARGEIVRGEFWPEDRNTSRLFFAPTGRPIPQGEGYAGLFLILPFVGYGATENLSLAGGVPIVGDLGSVPFWVAPKLRLHSAEQRDISVGALLFSGVEGWDEPRRTLAGIVYGVGTFGTRDSAIHAGTGVGFSNEEDSGTVVPVMVGGEHRITRRNKLVTENWWIPGEGAMATGGLRIMGERWTTDLGLGALFGATEDWETDTIPYFPIISFSYGFGGR
jgi:hypothetical protein